MVKEAYVSLEVAKLLKEKGFNEKCRGGYHSEFDDNDNPIIMLEEWTAQPYNNDFVDEGFLCSAPTHQMAIKWLREVRGLSVEIFSIKGTSNVCPVFWKGNVVKLLTQDRVFNGELVSSYEESVEAALKYTLENLI